MKEAEEVREQEARLQPPAGVAAFFDLDGTMTALPSLERRFFRTLRYRRAIPPQNYLLWLREAIRLAPRGLKAILQANKMYLHGIAVDRSGAGGPTLSDRVGICDRLRSGLTASPAFFREVMERAAWHAKQGHAIVLVSGTLEPLALKAARAMEAELAAREIVVTIRVCATRLEEMDGQWTGRILSDAMFGEAKARAVKHLAEQMHLDLARCCAYGDSENDRWLLAAVGRPAAVNPTKGLARIARRCAWPELYWSKAKNLTQRASTQSSQRSGWEVARSGVPQKQNEDVKNQAAMREARFGGLG